MEGENKITQGVIWKQILVFFFPILRGHFSSSYITPAGCHVVRNFVGKSGTAAVGGGTGTYRKPLGGIFRGSFRPVQR